MAVKIRRALKATLAVAACAALALSAAGMAACSGETEVKGEGGDNLMSDLERVQSETVSDDLKEFSGTLETVGFLNAKLKSQKSWHSDKETVSKASIFNTTTTKTQKDYKDGVLVAEETVYSSASSMGLADNMSHQFMFVTEPEEDRCVYVREGKAPTTADDEIASVVWYDDAEPELWSETYYNIRFGLFMDEISLYVLNENTLLYTYDSNGNVLDNGCGDIIKNEDGTYSQTFILDTIYSVYYYSYSMMTHGGLDYVPEFSSVQITFTFDENWNVLEILEEDNEKVYSMGFQVSNTSTTTTTFSYNEKDFDDTTFNDAVSFFEPFMDTLVMQTIEEDLPAESENDGEEDE